MKQLKKYREEYEYSYLFQFIRDSWIGEGDIYKKIDFEVILDPDLSINDLSIYMAIVKFSSYKDFYQKIPHQAITRTTGIRQDDQSRSIKKIKEK